MISTACHSSAPQVLLYGYDMDRIKESLILHISTSSRLIYITGFQVEKKSDKMLLSGLKPPAQLNLEGNIAINWRTWLNAYELYAIAVGVITKSEKVQSAVFLQVAGPNAQKVARTLNLDSTETKSRR